MTNRAGALLSLLQKLSPEDPKEAEFRDQMLALAEVGAHGDSDPFSRRHFDPGHFTASAFILHPQERATALIFHGKLHRWLQPGGHIDPEDKSVEQAARREVREELGVEDLELHPSCPGIFDVDIHEIPAHKNEPDHQHLDVRFLFVATDPTLRTGSDAQDSRWVALDEVSELESDASVMRALHKLRTLVA